MLHDKYLLPRDHADLIASFLKPMLRLHPEKRAKASELVHHAWLDSIVVQGELDVIREAEAEDLRRRQAEAAAGAVGDKPARHSHDGAQGGSRVSTRAGDDGWNSAEEDQAQYALRLLKQAEESEDADQAQWALSLFKEAEAAAAARRSAEERQLERDAMKPVEEDVSPDPGVDAPPASAHAVAAPAQGTAPEVVRIDKPKKTASTR